MNLLASILLKLSENGMVFINDANRYEFIEFEEPEEIEFFRNIDWIIDYNDFVCSTDEEIEEYGQKSIDTLNLTIQSDGKDALDQANYIEFEIMSIKDLLLYRKGEIKFNLPGEAPQSPLKRFIQRIRKK